jgi:hypothetical protein
LKAVNNCVKKTAMDEQEVAELLQIESKEVQSS